jgi:N4-gp56 family major capsid protein
MTGIIVPGLPSSVLTIVQDRTLERAFLDSLFPYLLFRGEARPELWAANLGERVIFTRSGDMPVRLAPLTPGVDPSPSEYPFEQWEAVASQYGDSIDTHMPTSHVAIASLLAQNVKKLGMNAGRSLNTLTRNPLFRAYLGGNTNLIAAASGGALAVRVASLAGFRRTLNAAGQIFDVSPTNPLNVTVDAVANTVIGAIPDSAAQPDGPGTLALGTALGAGVALRDVVLAENRSRIHRVGGAASVDGLTGGNILTMQDVITSVGSLRANNVPPHPDGFYHVHLSAEAETQLYADAAFQRLFQSLPDSMPFRDLVIGQLIGCRFYRNTECPNSLNSGALVDTSGGGGSARCAPYIGGEVINQSGVAVRRAIVVGGACIVEKYIDESAYITQAGVNGKIGQFSVTNNGVQIMTERIRMIMRAPQDKLGQVISTTWSWSGDFPIPSDGRAEGASPALFKRAIVIEHA